MKNIFKSLLIADLNQRKARKIIFKPGFNILTGPDNHVGKSSIMKSVYYTLGANVHFDDKWDVNSKQTTLTFSNENGEYKITRFGTKYCILKEKQLIACVESTGELREYLPQIFGKDFYTKTKKDDKYHRAYPVFYYLPYYIDQDAGWNTKNFSNFKDLDMYGKNNLKKALYEHLGANYSVHYKSVEKHDKLINEKENVENKITRLENTVKTLKESLDNNVLTNNYIFIDGLIEETRKKINNLTKEIENTWYEITQLHEELADLKHSLTVIKEYNKLKTSNPTTPEIATHCPNCGYDLTASLYEQVRMNYLKLNEEILYERIKNQYNNTEKKLKKKIELYKELQEQLAAITTNSNSNNNNVDNSLVISETIVRLQEQINCNTNEKKEIISEINKLDKEINTKELETEINQCFKKHYSQRQKALQLNDEKNKIDLDMNFGGQGTVMTKSIICYYSAFFDTMDERNYPFVQFPFLIDSPKTKETSKANTKILFESISTIKLDQIIISTVDYADELVTKKPYIITLDKPFELLNSEDYQENQEEILVYRDILVT